jgi:hypothetical protein
MEIRSSQALKDFGLPNWTFHPDVSIAREKFAKFLRILHHDGENSSDSDVEAFSLTSKAAGGQPRPLG